jgi:hypothetical protein
MEYDRSPSQRIGRLAKSDPAADRGLVTTPVNVTRVSTVPATITRDG